MRRMAGEAAYDDKFVRFIVLFNHERDYFECHEVMEELWLEEGRSLFYQGLLQVAVGLHHWQNDNISGAIKLLTAAIDKLERYGDREGGLDVARVREQSRAALARLSDWMAQTGGAQGARPVAAHAAKPPAFEPFPIMVTDEQLRRLADALAAAPPEGGSGDGERA